MPRIFERAAHVYAVVLLDRRHGLEKLKEGIAAAPLAQSGADVGGVDGPQWRDQRLHELLHPVLSAAQGLR
jgi:hypothetical protein